MLRNIFLKKGVATLCIVSALLPFSIDIDAALDGRWIHHTAMASYSSFKESQIYKIIDGNKYVYFAVRGGNVTFNPKENWYYSYIENTALVQLFRYDKSKEWNQENIEPFGSLETVKNSFPAVVEYSPRLGVLAVIYENNDIDLIHDDGRIIYSGALRDVSNAQWSANPRAVTFDPDRPEMYLATSFGYLHIDVNTGEAMNGVNIGKYVSWICRMGNRMVAFAGNNISRGAYATTAYSFPAGNPPKSLDGCEIKLSSAIPSITMGNGNTLINLQALMPLTDNTFAAIAPSTAETKFYIVSVTLDEQGNKGELLSANETFDNNSSANNRQLFRTDGFWQETPEGYRIAGQTNYYVIKKGVEPDYSSSDAPADFKASVLTTIPKPKEEFSETEKAVKTASSDGKRTWFYAYDTHNTTNVVARGFYYRDFTDGAWSQKSDVVAPNAPTMAVAGSIEWNPKYGMIFRGPGSDGNPFGDNRPELADGMDLLCSYKDGVWTNRSYAANLPRLTSFSNCMKYVNVDPLNPDWIWGQYMKAGLLRMDLDDYANVMMYGSDANSLKNSAGYYPRYTKQPYYTLLCNFSNVSFDAEGNMWYVYHDKFGSDYDSEYFHMAYTRLNLLTPEDRLKMSELPTKGELVMPKEFRLKNVETYYDSHVLALRAPGNENFIVHSKGTFVGPNDACLIYDHNGTLEDESDDRQIKIYDLRDEEGNMMRYLYECSIYEDPVSGELWINTQRGPMIVNPREMFEGSKKFRRLKLEGEGADGEDFLFDNVVVLKMIDDRMGRKWLATQTDGVFCLSRDGKQILAHFTSGNSSLPSDFVMSIGCDQETGAIFMGTDKGLVEFQPEESNDVPEGIHLSIWPSAVTPEYNGYVNISGAVTGAEYIVEDMAGNIVKDLGAAESSRMQWDARDDSGKTVSPGRYNIRRRNFNETHRVNVIK